MTTMPDAYWTALIVHAASAEGGGSNDHDQ